MNSKNLDEKSFILGLESKKLPLEPEYLDRAAYNKGIEIFKEARKVRSNCGVNTSLISMWEGEKIMGIDISRHYKDIKENMEMMTKEYMGFIKLVESVPQLKSHIKTLEEDVAYRYEFLKTIAKETLK